MADHIGAGATREGVIAPGGTVGVLGGGQLGRMLAIAAAQLGLRTHIFAPDHAPPATDVAAFATTAAWDDEDALRRFANTVDVVTLEFENVPVAAVDFIAAIKPVRPGRDALATAQDRLDEKRFLRQAGAATAPFAPVTDEGDLRAALAEIGAPAILKTRRLGYDGKGQARISTEAEAAPALAAMAGAPAILEGFVDFVREISVVAARSPAGDIASFEAGENVHEDGILRRTTVPARSSRSTLLRAKEIAASILSALDYVGVIGVEMFETSDGELIVNEIAPRVHNTGHWTIEAAATDQFQQHIKAICGWPLGDPRRHANAEMENLIGDEVTNWAAYSATPGAALHLYGKSEARDGRKMGHVTRLMPIK